MVPEEGVARISLGGFAIGLCGAAPGFRAPKSRAFPRYSLGTVRAGNPPGESTRNRVRIPREIDPGWSWKGDPGVTTYPSPPIFTSKMGVVCTGIASHR